MLFGMKSPGDFTGRMVKQRAALCIIGRFGRDDNIIGVSVANLSICLFHCHIPEGLLRLPIVDAQLLLLLLDLWHTVPSMSDSGEMTMHSHGAPTTSARLTLGVVVLLYSVAVRPQEAE